MKSVQAKLKKLFEEEDFDAVVEKATPLLAGPDARVAARLICACHIRAYNTDALDSFLEQHKELSAELAFERAYADFANKRDAAWFLKEKCGHPKAEVLRSQILYRKMQFYDAATALIKYQPTQTEMITNLLAFASRSNQTVAAEYMAVDSESYEYYYNLSLYLFSHCRFPDALKAYEKCQALFDQEDQESKSEKDTLNIRLMGLICQSYCGLKPKYYCSEEPEALQPFLQILDRVQSLRFSRPDYSTLTKAVEQLEDAEKFFKGMKLDSQHMQQLCNLQTTVHALQRRSGMRPLTLQNTRDYSQFQLSNLIFAFLCQQSLPTTAIVRRFKKTPEAFPEYQQIKMQNRPLRSIEATLCGKLDPFAAENCCALLRAFGAYADMSRFGSRFQQLAAFQNTELSRFRTEKTPASIAQPKLTELQIVRQEEPKKEAKPMPQKWLKKAKKGPKKAQHHQGQVLAAGDKTEVSAVPTQQNKKPFGKPRGRR